MFFNYRVLFSFVILVFITECDSENVTQQSPVPERYFVANSILTNDVKFPERHESTTYKYPTATWSAHKHAKKNTVTMQDMWKLYLFKPSPFLKPPFTDGETGAAISRIEDGLDVNGHRKGKIKWKDSGYSAIPQKKIKLKQSKEELLDKFLQNALQRYIMSANLTDEFGTITLEMFAEALNKVTSSKKPAYDENKELHRKFKVNNLSAKKMETTTSTGLVEKQYQKRLQKSWDVRNENMSVPSRAALLHTVENATFEATPVFTASPEFNNESLEETTAVSTATLTHEFSAMTSSTTETTTEVFELLKPKRGYLKSSRGKKKYRDTLPKSDTKTEALVLSESAYYHPRKTVHEDPPMNEVKYGAIPGVPNVDYPTLSAPVATGFKCPKFKEGSSKMVADPKTRCQVFYMCNGDGPPTPMLCPNGTLFNENVLVCDWWFNVDC